MTHKIFTAFIFASIFAVSCNAQDGAQGAKITIQERLHHFGEVQSDTLLSHTFTFENSGSDTLVVEELSASCGCTAALLDNARLAPGEKGEVKVTLNTRGKRGNVRQSVDIFTNDENAWFVTVFVEATVLPKQKPHSAK